jgi:hypothetical protein
MSIPVGTDQADLDIQMHRSLCARQSPEPKICAAEFGEQATDAEPQQHRRLAVHGLLEKAFNLVSKWDAEARLEEALYALLDSLDAPVSLKKGEAFAVVLYCVVPNVDDKLRSKWARVLRFAALTMPFNEPLRVFIKRKGGINACASRYAEYVRRPGKV